MAQNAQKRTTSASGTYALGKDLASQVPIGANILLQGELGSGKTVFAQGLLMGLGVTDPVKSPTFTLLHEYQHPRGRAAHFDLYRLPEKPSYEELAVLGIFDRLSDPEVLTLVEWPQRLESHFDPSQHYLVTLVAGEGDIRDVSVTAPERV